MRNKCVAEGENDGVRAERNKESVFMNHYVTLEHAWQSHVQYDVLPQLLASRCSNMQLGERTKKILHQWQMMIWYGGQDSC